MNNYNPYDPNQNQSYGDPQNTINGQGTESTYSQGGGQEQNTQPYHGQTQGIPLIITPISLLIKT